MISLLSFIIVLVGAFNWLSIGVLQFDFVAGIFGSQANIFSRVVYAIVGFSAFWLIYATMKQRGRIVVNGKKENDEKLLGKLKDRLTKTKPEDEHKGQEPTEKSSEPTKAENATEAVGEQTPQNPTKEPQKTEAPQKDKVPPITMQNDDTVGITPDDETV